jgi:hypothetical protein
MDNHSEGVSAEQKVRATGSRLAQTARECGAGLDATRKRAQRGLIVNGVNAGACPIAFTNAAAARGTHLAPGMPPLPLSNALRYIV